MQPRMIRLPWLLASVLLGLAVIARGAPLITSMDPTEGQAGTIIRLEGQGLKKTEHVLFSVGSTITKARFRVLPNGALEVIAPEYYREGAAATVAVFTKEGVTVAMPAGGRVVERDFPNGSGVEPGLSFFHVLDGGSVRQLSSPGVIERGGQVQRASSIGMVFVKAGGMLQRFDDHAGVVFYEAGANFGDAIVNRHPASAMGPLIPIGNVTVSPDVGPFLFREPPRPEPAYDAPRDAPLIKSVSPWEAIMGEVVSLKGRGFLRTTDVYFDDRTLGLRKMSFRIVSDTELRVQVADRMSSMGAQFIIVVTTEGATVTIPRDNVIRSESDYIALRQRGPMFVDFPVRWAGPGEAVADKVMPLIYIGNGGHVTDASSQVIFVESGGKLDDFKGRPALLVYEEGAKVPERFKEESGVTRRVRTIEPSFLATSFRITYGQLIFRSGPSGFGNHSARGAKGAKAPRARGHAR